MVIEDGSTPWNDGWIPVLNGFKFHISHFILLPRVPPSERNALFALTAERRGFGSVAMQELIFGQCPSFDEIIDGLRDLEREINS